MNNLKGEKISIVFAAKKKNERKDKLQTDSIQKM